jgi:methionyl-tRNA synthetase
VNAKLDSVVPGPDNFEGGETPLHTESTPAAELDQVFVKDINARLAEYAESMDSTKLRHGLAMVMSVSARGNQYLQDSGLDNSLLANHPERCGQVLLNAVNLIYILSVLVHPFMPTISEGILRQLNAPARSLPSTFTIDILPGHKLGKAEHLFKRIDNVDGAQEKAWQKQYGGDSTMASKVQPAGPGGHPEGGKVPHMPEGGRKKAVAPVGRAQLAKEKKEAAESKKTPEEKELEGKIEAQGKVLAGLKTGKTEGDVEKEMGIAKGLKAELAELKKRLKEASLE